MKKTLSYHLIVLVFAFTSCQEVQEGPIFEISFSDSLIDQAQDGRLILMLSINDASEPRFQISDGPESQLAFGIDVEDWEPGKAMLIDAEAFGYPIRSLKDIPEGTYQVQALLNRYETFNLKDGRTLKLPPDKGEGQQWNRKPGNFYNLPQQVNISKNGKISIMLDQEIPPIPDPEDTKYVKHVKMKSEMLSEWWGRDVYLGANVLIPHGFEEHPEARYPLMIFHGHFPYTFGGWRESPPDPDLEPDYAARFGISGYNIIQQQEAYDQYQQWISPGFPRYLVIEIQHPTPYYDDSYAVNSENQGPYGDAITYELIPHIEEMFRGIGEGWSRFLYGGSTGGWESLAVMVKYPDEYGACFAACPDPIDFQAFTVVDIYKDKNAYYLESPWKKTPRPGKRDYLGYVSATLEEMNHRELVLGTKGRSGQQWDIWEATYSPAGEDGYPARLWDKITGEINQDVAAYWKENYDLGHILRRDWEKGLGEQLKGKIHIYCGDMDNYYLNNAVYLVEEFLESTTNPIMQGRWIMEIAQSIVGMETKKIQYTFLDSGTTPFTSQKS
ncbi:Putative esterase [Belliella buryatensis]|uniref:Putative esterase n=1 Tax=Belliella buryatensis TaxID=1500549 RepID=A0A239GBH5_9BACT|nr:Putative esterase [Belliella buryatensis]